METDEADKQSWTELRNLYEAAASNIEAAMRIVQTKMAAGVEPSLEDLVRLQNAYASEAAIELQMRDRAG